MVKLKDIKPLEEIDFSLLDYLIIAFVIIFLIILFFALIRLFRKKEDILKEKLKEIDFNNPKKTAYIIGSLRPFLNKEAFNYWEELNKKLERYKYKKEVEAFSEEIKQEINLFLKMIE